MRNRLKCATAVAITVVMLLTLLSASLAAGDGEVLSAPVFPGLEDGGALLSQVEEQTDTDESNITVTFVMNNAYYTNDPGSAETHLTVKAPIDGGRLTYTSWAGRYKVTGTGTVCSYAIPAGTSLADNGYAFPALTVENIGSNNTYSFSSTCSWVTEEGMVSSTATVFSEDVTLALQLYVGSEYYQLDFVCGEENHSIKTVRNFLLGQSISAADIDAATAAAAEYTSQYCTHGTAHGETLAKWQLKVTATEEMVNFSAGMPIVNEYQMGSLKVDKKVSGNLASTNQAFSIDVTFIAEDGKIVKSDISYGGDKVITAAAMADGSETVTIELLAGQDCTFSNIPAGVTYTVVEQSKHTEADSNGSDPSKGYTVTYSGEYDGTISASDNDTVTVTNTKGATIDTGITTDTLPYVLLMGIVLLAGVAMIITRRAHNN